MQRGDLDVVSHTLPSESEPRCRITAVFRRQSARDRPADPVDLIGGDEDLQPRTPLMIGGPGSVVSKDFGAFSDRRSRMRHIQQRARYLAVEVTSKLQARHNVRHRAVADAALSLVNPVCRCWRPSTVGFSSMLTVGRATLLRLAGAQPQTRVANRLMLRARWAHRSAAVPSLERTVRFVWRGCRVGPPVASVGRPECIDPRDHVVHPLRRCSSARKVQSRLTSPQEITEGGADVPGHCPVE